MAKDLWSADTAALWKEVQQSAADTMQQHASEKLQELNRYAADIQPCAFQRVTSCHSRHFWSASALDALCSNVACGWWVAAVQFVASSVNPPLSLCRWYESELPSSIQSRSPAPHITQTELVQLVGSTGRGEGWQLPWGGGVAVKF
jgi:hypothetical protein